ncbi:MAG: helix-turn-helix domain-containing protein, partial [Pseudonocardia sp.]|nr:helix-turn-helix domain-containing protein [Pseudonocardia sp.]
MSRSPVVARRRLGASLKELRLGAELKLEDAANELRCSASKVSRLENGKGVPRERDVRDLLNLYGAAAREAELTQLVVDGLGDGSGSVLDQREGVEKDVVSDDTWRYQELESDAVRILTLERDFIPGLLQTEGYARALVRLFLPDLPDEQVDRFVRLRKQRQVVLERLDAPDARGLELAVVVD